MSTTNQFTDITLKCRDCGKDFVWTAEEQAFYQSKGFQNAPVRCPDCRKLKKQKFNRGPKQMYTITCANCGKEDQVPFMPKGDRPVLCKECYDKERAKGQTMQPQAEASQEQPQEIPAEESLPEAA